MEKLLKQVDKTPSLKDAGGGLTNMIPSNPLTDGMGSMITGQLMSPPTVYYVAAFAVLILSIVGCLIYLFIKVRSVDKSVKTLVKNPNNQQFSSPVQQSIQQPQVIGYDQTTGQPIMAQPQIKVAPQPQTQQPVNQGFQSGMFWPNGSQMSQRDIEKEQKPLRKRGIVHLLKTLFMVIGDPDSLNKIRTGAYNPALNRVAPQFQQPMQQYQQPIQQMQQIPQQYQQQIPQQFQQQMPQQVNQPVYGDPRLPNNVNPQSNVIPMPTLAQR